MAEERVQRRLAAILAADVVGYSRLVERDEAGTLAALRERRKSILQPRAVEHRGPTYGVFHGHNGQSENREFDSSRVATNPGRGRHRPFHNSYWAHQLILMGGVSPPLVRETRTLLGVRPSRAANIAGRVESAYQIGRTGTERQDHESLHPDSVIAMRLARGLAAMLVFSMGACALSSATSAGPQDYCLAYARQAANNKTGLAPDADAAADERWQGAYKAAFSNCMDSYKPEPLKSSAGAASKSSKSKLGRKSPAAKSIRSPRSSKRKHATKPQRRFAYRPPKSSLQKANPRAERPASHSKSLCRRLEVDKKGAYQIKDCKPGA